MLTYTLSSIGTPMFIYEGENMKYALDKLRYSLFLATCEGDEIARLALLDWYEERGFIRV